MSQVNLCIALVATSHREELFQVTCNHRTLTVHLMNYLKDKKNDPKKSETL